MELDIRKNIQPVKSVYLELKACCLPPLKGNNKGQKTTHIAIPQRTEF